MALAGLAARRRGNLQCGALGFVLRLAETGRAERAASHRDDVSRFGSAGRHQKGAADRRKVFHFHGLFPRGAAPSPRYVVWFSRALSSHNLHYVKFASMFNMFTSSAIPLILLCLKDSCAPDKLQSFNCSQKHLSH